jgi:hypothetical protein
MATSIASLQDSPDGMWKRAHVAETSSRDGTLLIWQSPDALSRSGRLAFQTISHPIATPSISPLASRSHA